MTLGKWAVFTNKLFPLIPLLVNMGQIQWVIMRSCSQTKWKLNWWIRHRWCSKWICVHLNNIKYRYVIWNNFMNNLSLEAVLICLNHWSCIRPDLLIMLWGKSMSKFARQVSLRQQCECWATNIHDYSCLQFDLCTDEKQKQKKSPTFNQSMVNIMM